MAKSKKNAKKTVTSTPSKKAKKSAPSSKSPPLKSAKAVPIPDSGVPAGYHTATPYLAVRGAAAALAFYAKAFGAKELGRLTMPDGAIAHAEIQIGDSRIMLADEMPDWGNKGPQTLGGSPVGLCLYVKDADAEVARALQAGAEIVRPVKDEFYGDRSGHIIDPFGHRWTISQRKEDVSFREMQRRMEALPHEPLP